MRFHALAPRLLGAAALAVIAALWAAPALASSTARQDFNARLNAMLPHGAVTAHEGQYVGTVAIAQLMEPMPPPEVLARARYIFESNAGGGPGSMKMWVTGVSDDGSLCTGWMLRFPDTLTIDTLTAPHVPVGPSNGIQIGSARAVQTGLAAGLDPIILGYGTAFCDSGSLTPYSPPAPSP